jgi:hypothetical protein
MFRVYSFLYLIQCHASYSDSVTEDIKPAVHHPRTRPPLPRDVQAILPQSSLRQILPPTDPQKPNLRASSSFDSRPSSTLATTLHSASQTPQHIYPWTRKGPSPTVDPGDGLGPTAQYPYLPETHHSCRPGGPRLFDLVCLEPVAEYGVLAWAVDEKDEKIFQVDDCTDEDKAMQALWARWIFLNRSVCLSRPTISTAFTILDEPGWISSRIITMGQRSLWLNTGTRSERWRVGEPSESMSW